MPSSHAKAARPWPVATVRDGRALTGAILACGLLGLLVVGPQSFWWHAGVPHVTPAFADMRTITSGWECTRSGRHVIPVNPCDPWLQPMNYPRIWMWPAFLGIGQSATPELAMAMVLLFLGAVFVTLGRLSVHAGLVLAVAIVSPAVLLGIERGNVDLFVFTLVAAAVLLLRRGPRWRAGAKGILLLAAMLKLYPAFAFAVLFRDRRRVTVAGAATVVAVFGVYVLAIFGQIHEIFRVTPRVDGYSYGVGPLADALGRSNLPKSAFELAAVALGLGVAAGIARVRRSVDARPVTDAFVAGAAIYCGSYIFFYNFDYRLIFLLLVLPALIGALDGSASRLPAPALGVALALAALWLGTQLPPLPAPFGSIRSAKVGELVNWLLFTYLAAGLLIEAVAVVRRAGGSRSEPGLVHSPPSWAESSESPSSGTRTSLSSGRSGTCSASATS